MANAGLMIAGGLLAGAGEALKEDGKAMRERALREMEMRFRAGESEKDREFRAGESDKDRGFRKEESGIDREFRAGESRTDREFRAGESDKDRTFRSGESQADRAFRSGESKVDREFRAGESDKDRENRNGLLANTERFEDSQGRQWLRKADGSVTPLVGSDGKQVIGKPKTPERMEEVYDPTSPTDARLVPASQAAGQPSGKNADKRIVAKTEREDTARRDARKQAEKEAGEKAGLFSSDSSDFKDTGGSRSQWIEKRTNEILNERKGGKTSEGSPAANNSGGSEKSGDKKAPQYSRENPAKPTTRAEVDALPSGTPFINPADGKVYRKN